MIYEEVVQEILETPRFGGPDVLGNTRRLLAQLGGPQNGFPVIHVAGSNGKGSVCAYLASVLKESGRRVGLFTSPHLTDIRERFQVLEPDLTGLCGKEIFLSAEARVRQAAKVIEAEGFKRPGFFAYVLAIALLLFREAGVDIAVIETGLGGRLDPTNVVERPLLTVITSIALEHQEYLGDTLIKIAGEKAGIIKEGVPVVYDASDPSVIEVIKKAAQEKQAPAYGIRPENIKILLKTQKYIDFSFKSEYNKELSVRILAKAPYQVRNAALALAGIQILRSYFREEIPEEAVCRGLIRTSWPGRMEEILPQIYLDGAHNPAGIEAFLEGVRGLAEEQQALLLFSMGRGKDMRESIRLIHESGLFEEVVEKDLSEDPTEAFHALRKKKREGQLLFCTGSLYLVGAIRQLVEYYFAGGLSHD